MSLTRIGEPWQRCRKKTASERKLVAERLAQRENLSGDGSGCVDAGLIAGLSSKQSRESSPSTRPQISAATDGVGGYVAARLVVGMVKAMRAEKSARPQAKTAARKAFEHWFGPNDYSDVRRDAGWAIWQAGWRTARGRKPTTREAR